VAGVFALFLLALAGIPLTSGFTGKFAVFSAAVSGGATPLVVVGAIASAMAAFFYVRVIVMMFFAEPVADGPVVVMPGTGTAGAIAVAAANRLAGAGYRAHAAAFTEVPMGGTCIDFVYREIGCIHSYAVELPPSLPRGGPLGATLLGVLRGDPKRWWREGQAPPAQVGIEAGDEMAAALSALVDHLFGAGPAGTERR
jgi:NADH:ubiquinone oxidoreductase subunit 5 (subunit L)/multisubunit Na+/H+ antiporter MnhA subunit